MRNHSKLVKKHFDSEYIDYDRLIRKLIPKYSEMHEKVIGLVKLPKNKQSKILDLGIGTGQTALGILKKSPKTKIEGIDLSKNMLKQSKNRLKKYLKRVSFNEGDITYLKTRKNKYDACIAVLSIHHLNEKQKQVLFNRIYKSLKKGGIFVIGDIIKFDTLAMTKKKEKEWKKFLIKNLGEEKGQYWFDNYLEEDLPSSVQIQLMWLKKAGFKETKPDWHYMNYAVFHGKK